MRDRLGLWCIWRVARSGRLCVGEGVHGLAAAALRACARARRRCATECLVATTPAFMLALACARG